jgi:hypothetical protein
MIAPFNIVPRKAIALRIIGGREIAEADGRLQSANSRAVPLRKLAIAPSNVTLEISYA